MKQVGILTLFYKTWNFGAQLQAYALQKVIEGLGYECEQIRFAWSIEQTRLNYEAASINQAAFETFARQIPHSKRVYTPQNLHEANKDYDIFVCGSDQIWGVRNSMPIHVLPQMMLSFVQEDKKRIAYGASFGSADIPENRKEVLCRFLDGLDFISMRETSAVSVLQRMTERKVISVLDPTMLLTAKEWIELAEKGRGTYPKEHYVLLYNVSCNNTVHNIAVKFAEEKGIRMVNLAYLEGMSVGPCDFVSLIAHADYVITNSFHGTIFSILFHKRFITFGVDAIPTEFSRNIRIKDMLDVCGLKDYFFSEVGEECLAVLEKPIDYSAVDYNIRKAKDKSINYLQTALRADSRKSGFRKASEQLLARVIKTGLCTGCSACTKCGSSCITMKQDKLGFYKPEINCETCSNCRKCLEICPVYAEQGTDTRLMPKLATFAMRAKDEGILKKSSSGGVFSILAETFLENGGVVCGAIYDTLNGLIVKHVCVSKKEALDALRKSKYVQSDMKHCYLEIEQYLKQGKEVLFTGTPCQTAGLQTYLQKSYENLYIVDLICGGVTAPLLWKKYVSFYKERNGIEAVDMRSQEQGVYRDDGKLAFSISHIENGEEKYYEKEEDLFLNTRFAFYNECCYQCGFKEDFHSADITIGDCVGFNLIIQDKECNKGVSLVFVRSEKGRSLIESEKDKFLFYPVSYKDAIVQNEMIESSMRKPLGIDYLRGIAPISTVERLFYETRQIRLLQEKEEIFKNFILELKRNELLLKVKKYAALHCRVENDPLIQGDIVIYGAGKVGRALLDCLEKGPVCILDRSNRVHNLYGYPVYQTDSVEFDKLYKEKVLTILVTPIWDYWEIREQLETKYPKLNIVSLDKVVEKIWV